MRFVVIDRQTEEIQAYGSINHPFSADFIAAQTSCGIGKNDSGIPGIYDNTVARMFHTRKGERSA